MCKNEQRDNLVRSAQVRQNPPAPVGTFSCSGTKDQCSKR